MSQARKNIEQVVLKSIQPLCHTRDFSSADILRYLPSKQPQNTVDSEAIVQYLDNAVEKGLLKKLIDGKYKVNETARRRKSRSRSRSRAKPKRRSRSRKRAGSRRRKRSSSGRRRKRSSSGRRRKRSSSGRRRKRSTSGHQRRSRRRTKEHEYEEHEEHEEHEELLQDGSFEICRS